MTRIIMINTDQISEDHKNHNDLCAILLHPCFSNINPILLAKILLLTFNK